MPRPRQLRVLPADVDRLQRALEITWIQKKQTLQPGNRIDILGALAMEAGVDVSGEFRNAFEYCADEFGRDYVRGLCQGWDNSQSALRKRQNLENPDYLEGYEDGLVLAAHVGLLPSKPVVDYPQKLRESPPHDPVRLAAPVSRYIALERKRKAERSPEEQAELDVYRIARRAQTVHLHQ